MADKAIQAQLRNLSWREIPFRGRWCRRGPDIGGRGKEYRIVAVSANGSVVADVIGLGCGIWNIRYRDPYGAGIAARRYTETGVANKDVLEPSSRLAVARHQV